MLRYSGPLVDTHLHLGPGGRRHFRSAEALFRYLDKNHEEWAVGFYSDILPQGPDPLVVPFAAAARGRVIPLLQPHSPVLFGVFAKGEYTEGVLRAYLQPRGTFAGVGELAFYPSDMQTVTFNSPSVQTVFQVVNGMKGIVMIHPSDPFADPLAGARQMDVSEIEPSIRNYPDAIFLFHGGPNSFDLVSPLMAKYPNIYYTMDANIWLMGGPRYRLMEPGGPGTGNSQQFFEVFRSVGVEQLLEVSLPRFLSRIRQHPDRVMWGTDRGAAWHFDEEVTDVIIGMSRRAIATLPPDLQEKYAFRNAQRVFGRFLAPVP